MKSIIFLCIAIVLLSVSVRWYGHRIAALERRMDSVIGNAIAQDTAMLRMGAAIREIRKTQTAPAPVPGQE